ncbi:P-loop containing nucleoside triphosphate hydrolase protein [Auricularia subglabra TFB-10046 SS5]|nr:P-loop containing nucleoside triphosphate hydrolase protein [Auricularia subglabra TFB-10046 SS5]
MQALLRAPAPKLLVVDAPLTGLDPHARPVLSALLQSLHEEKAPRVIMALRAQDPLPEWITHVLRVSDGRAETITASSFTPAEMQVSKPATSPRHHRQHVEERGDVLAELKDVNVAYHERHVLLDVNWTIRAGEKWHLQGYNGSGKTTLTSLLTGAHPQSYTQKHLHLFGLPRPKMPTPVLAQRIGHTSPEIAAAAPRRATLTAADLIGTGFDGHFAWRARSASEAARVRDVMALLGVADKPVTELAPGEHATVLLARALVARPELVILDEAFMGMSKAQVERATRFLRDELGEGQAAVWIGHWEGECPWGDADGLHRIRLNGGKEEIVSLLSCSMCVGFVAGICRKRALSAHVVVCVLWQPLQDFCASIVGAYHHARARGQHTPQFVSRLPGLLTSHICHIADAKHANFISSQLPQCYPS